jgi:hypothetical protein
MDWKRPLAPALRLAHSDQAPVEINVVPVESEQLAAAKAGVGEQGEQQPVAFPLAGKVALPDVVAFRCASRRVSSRRSSTSGSASRFFGVRRTSVGLRSRYSFSTRKRKNPFSAATVRAWLPIAGRRSASSARKARRCPGRTWRRSSLSFGRVADASGDVAPVGRARRRRQPPLDPTVVEEVFDLVLHRNPPSGNGRR